MKNDHVVTDTCEQDTEMIRGGGESVLVLGSVSLSQVDGHIAPLARVRQDMLSRYWSVHHQATSGMLIQTVTLEHTSTPNLPSIMTASEGE